MKKTIIFIYAICLLSVNNNLKTMMNEKKRITPESYPYFYNAYIESLKKKKPIKTEHTKENFRQNFLTHLETILDSKTTDNITIKPSLLQYIVKIDDEQWANKIDKAFIIISNNNKHNN